VGFLLDGKIEAGQVKSLPLQSRLPRFHEPGWYGDDAGSANAKRVWQCPDFPSVPSPQRAARP